MSLKAITPCDNVSWDGRHHCPYCNDDEHIDCERYCGYDESKDDCEKEKTYYFLTLKGVHAFITEQIKEQQKINDSL